MSIDSYVARLREERQADAARFAALDGDTCQLCEACGPDMRSLIVDCFYAVNEAVPEVINLADVEAEHLKGRGWYLRICKTCRAGFLSHMATWAAECRALRGVPKDSDGRPDDEGGCIPVRVNGATVMMTGEQYAAYRESRGMK